MHGYAKSPFNAWAGWRLRVPGGPVGGQYHGYLAGIQPEEVWGGTALHEGETVSDYVYRGPAEVRPRANASGGANVIRSYQTLRTPGYGEAPGNYAALGGLGLPVEPVILRRPILPIARPGASTGVPRVPVRQAPGDAVVTHPVDTICPAWGCGPAPQWPPIYYAPSTPGATATVPQPPPPTTPAGSNAVADPNCKAAGYYRDAAGNCTNDWHNPYSLYLPNVGPSPTVAASPSDYLPSQGQTVPGITPGASTGSSFSDWLGSSTIINGVANQWVLGGGALLAFLLFKGKK